MAYLNLGENDILGRFPDLHRISKRFHRRIAGLEDVVRVYQAIGVVRRMVSMNVR
jgi:DNA mismatch repair protein MSH2